MAWIESHTVLTRHRKIIELAKDLRLKPVYVLGHLHALWHAALEQQEDGDLSVWSDHFIAESACYDGDAPQFVSLLQKHRWLDDRILHDWLDHAGKYLESKYKSSNYSKLQEIWDKHGLIYDKAPGKQMAPGWFKIRKQILERDENICFYCGQTSEFMEVDHIKPRDIGGNDDPENLVSCCRSCNRKKGAKDIAIFKPHQSHTEATPPNTTKPTVPNQTKPEGIIHGLRQPSG